VKIRSNFLAGLLALASICGAGSAPADGSLVSLAYVNVTDVLADVSGGLKREARILDKFDFTATFNGDDHGWPGISAFVDLQAMDGTDFSARVVGDAQTVSNIDAPAGARVFDAWVAKDFGGRAGVKAGIIDLNSEFDVQRTGALFLNSSHGIGPDFSQAGLNGPSIFPSTGAGLIGWWLPGGHWQIKSGVFEGIPGDPSHPGRTDIAFTKDEGVLLVLEIRNRLTPDVVVGAGAWRYTASFDAIGGRGRISDNSGIYAIADGALYKAPQGDDAGLSGWIRVGIADDRVNPIDATLGFGLVYTEPFGRKLDQAGISVGYAHWGAPARRASGLGAAETAIEATYSVGLDEHLSIQPDLQYVVSPSADPARADALVIGARFTATL